MSPSSPSALPGRLFLLPPPASGMNVESKGHFVVLITPPTARLRPLVQPAPPARIPLDSKVRGVGSPALSLRRAIRFPDLNTLMQSGTQTADMFQRHAALDVDQDDLASFLLHNLRAAKPSGPDGKTWTLEGSRIEAVMQAARLWDEPEIRLRLVDAMARSLAIAGEEAAGKAAHTLRRRILSMPEPDRTLLVCAYANGFQDNTMAVRQAFTITARRGKCDAAAQHAIETGLALQANPLRIYDTSSPEPPGPGRLRFAHLFATSAMGAPALSLEEIDARNLPPFDKAVLSVETVCRREPAVLQDEVSLLRKQLARHAFNIPKSTVSDWHVRTAVRVAHAPLPRRHTPLPHPHTMLGWMVAHAYDRLTRQAIDAAWAAHRSHPGDTRAGDRLHQLIMFLGDEQLALPGVDMPQRMADVMRHKFLSWTDLLLKASTQLAARTQTPSTEQ